ncbi:MAG: heavy metal translocating P-type ATPase metal-binding domain-containing protein [bacterium]|nr:heavy metal translocating P-type ATPase metal-binding domain-containing protein [bacterium]
MSETCFHCGDDIIGRTIVYDEKQFCCNGCSTVYQLLSENNLDNFYAIEKGAGVKPKNANSHKYAFLDVPEIRQKYVTYEDDKSVHITLFLPTIHCSSCIYLLENIQKIDSNVTSCSVNFVQKTAAIILKKEAFLSEFALLLDQIGYAPNFGDKKALQKKRNYQYLYKLGVAGFAFGSIMLWTFPEYLGIEEDNPEIRSFTAYLSLAVSIPVLLYSASDYLKSAYKALRFRSLNLDVPISIGIIALYAQSVYTILTDQGTGYMDSFAGFVFFLLIGKWFQSKTYESLSFERDYTAYFPVAVTRVQDEKEEIVEIDKIKVGDRIKLRNEEIIPCDAVLKSDTVSIDYSFVTGESEPIRLHEGDFIYAGGKIVGKPAIVQAEKESNRSQLTRIWNDSGEQSQEEKGDRLSVYFLTGVLILAAISAVLWYFLDMHRILEIVVAVLIVACPCALALSKPFTYGNITRILGRKGLFLKNTEVIEPLNETTDIVFDKTGTLTSNKDREVRYEGQTLDATQKLAISSITNASSHPLSRAITLFFQQQGIHPEAMETFEEISGEGIRGVFNEMSIMMGKATFVGASSATTETEVHLKIDDRYLGKFQIQSAFRPDIFNVLQELGKEKDIHVLSGDSEKDRSTIINSVSNIKDLHFGQSPEDKKDYIDHLQNRGKKVLMIGDGLNDAGALKKANVGIAISEDIFRFTPGSNAIIDADSLSQLPQLLKTSQFAKTILGICYAFSILYNIVGLTFAISGELTPLIAAILMPISSITIVFISTLSAYLKGR